MAWPVLSIHQHNVRPSVIIVVNKRATRAHGFGKIFFSECAIVVNEMDTRLGSDVAELNRLSVAPDTRDR